MSASNPRRAQLLFNSALGTATKKDTVTLALQKVCENARARRAAAIEDLLATADAGGFDYGRLEDLDQ